jgi:CHAT domain-containing protein/tetratricopeptide (TPR) repeat protein
MSSKRPLIAFSLNLVLIILFSSSAHAAERARKAQTSDEAALLSLTERYFAAFAAEDAAALTALWSAKSPDFEPAMKSLKGIFGALDRIEAKDLRLVKSNVEGERARALFSLELSAAIAQTGARYPGWGKGHRRLEFVKEDGAWKISREASAEDELAALYLKAATEEEREQLLAREPELTNEDLARRIWRQGQAVYAQNKYAEALSILRLALKVSERIDFQQGVADSLKVIALAERLLGDYKESLADSNRSLAIYRQIGDREGEAKVLNNLGLTFQFQADYPQALSYYQKSLAIFQELKVQWAIGATYSSLGTVYSAQGDHARALDYYEKGLALAREVKDRKAEANALNYIGSLYGVQGDYPQALSHLESALELLKGLKDRDGIAMTLVNIGVIYRNEGEGPRALDYYQQSLKIYQELGSKSYIAAATGNLGSVYMEMGDYARAIEQYGQALKMFEAMDEKAHMAAELSSLAVAYNLQGDYRKALEYSERASVLSRQIGRTLTYQEARTTFGSAALAMKKPESARKAFEEAITAIEALREQVAGGEEARGRFFENRISPYQEMVKLLVSENNPAEALDYAERAKGRVLLDVLRSGRINITKAMTPEEKERERQLNEELGALNMQFERESSQAVSDKQRIADLGARVQKARLEREAFRTKLYAAHPELKAQRGETVTIKPEEAAALLPDARSALLEYAVTNEQVFLFVLTRGEGGVEAGRSIELKVYPLSIKPKELDARAEAFRRALASRDLNFMTPARELYDLALAPAQKQLEGKTNLIIVPDAMLWNLPFQALRTPRDRYLIEDYSVAYAPSLTVLREMTKPQRALPLSAGRDLTLLAFGNPDTSPQTSTRLKVTLGEPLAALPEAERQVKTLAALYGPEQSRVYLGANASEDRLKAEAANFRVLQFAAHAVLNDSNPLYSHVVLSRPTGSTEDGRLEAWEMMNLNLRAKMVVLSACETARGRFGAGEGMIGMTWAFFIAGSPTTVASQWKVESSSTTELMLEFHRRIRASMQGRKMEISKAEALRQAALKLMKTDEYMHPFYWAGFVVVGDAR